VLCGVKRMGLETPVVQGAVESVGFFATPFGKVNLYITACLFIVLIIVGLSQSVEQHNLYPLADNTVLKLVGADSQIGQSIDELESAPRPATTSGLWFKTFPAVLWFWIKFVFTIVANVWFMWFFAYGLYQCFQMISNTSQLRSIILAGVTFAVIAILTGMIIYNLSLAGKCLVNDRAKNFNAQMANAYPLHGIVKLAVHIFNKDLFNKVADWTQTGLGQAISNIPSAPDLLNNSINITMNQTMNRSNLLQ